MVTLQDNIQQLSDADACRILTVFAGNQPDYCEQALTPELSEALNADADLTPTTANEGEIARAALLLLADDPVHQPVLTALVNGSPPQRYGLVETAVVLSGVLFVLGAHIELEYKDGKWRFKFVKKPTSEKLLKALLDKLQGFSDNKSG